MALVRHELPTAYPVPGLAGERVGRRARSRAAREAALAEENAKLAFIKSSGIVGKLVDLTPSLPGNDRRVKIGIAKPRIGHPMDVVAVFESHFSLRQGVFEWSSIVAEVVKKPDEEGYALKVNGRVEDAQNSQDDLLAHATRATNAGFYDPFSSSSSDRRAFFSHRLMRRREKVEIPGVRRRWFSS